MRFRQRALSCREVAHDEGFHGRVRMSGDQVSARALRFPVQRLGTYSNASSRRRAAVAGGTLEQSHSCWSKIRRLRTGWAEDTSKRRPGRRSTAGAALSPPWGMMRMMTIAYLNLNTESQAESHMTTCQSASSYFVPSLFSDGEVVPSGLSGWAACKK